MEDITLYNLPSYTVDKKSQFTQNRIPVDLPNVLGAAELEKEYEFTIEDLEKQWSPVFYGKDGMKQTDESCDTTGVAESELNILSYIPTVDSVSESRIWQLKAESGETGLTYDEDTSGITKGPAMPIGDISQFFHSPLIIPAVKIPGVTAPKPDKPKEEEPICDSDIGLSVKIIDYKTGEEVTNRKVCPTEFADSPILTVVVDVSYSPNNENCVAEFPEGSFISLSIAVEGGETSVSGDTSGILLYPGTTPTGAGGAELVNKETSLSGITVFTKTYTFNYVTPTGLKDDATITATAKIGVPGEIESYVDEDYAQVGLDCADEDITDLIEAELQMRSWATGEDIGWSIECCNTKGKEEQDNRLSAVLVVKNISDRIIPAGYLEYKMSMTGASKNEGEEIPTFTGIDSPSSTATAEWSNLGATFPGEPIPVGESFEIPTDFQYFYNVWCAKEGDSDKNGSIDFAFVIFKSGSDAELGDAVSGSGAEGDDGALRGTEQLELNCTCDPECGEDAIKKLFEGSEVAVYEVSVDGTRGDTADKERTTCGDDPAAERFQVAFDYTYGASNSTDSNGSTGAVEEPHCRLDADASLYLVIKPGSKNDGLSWRALGSNESWRTSEHEIFLMRGNEFIDLGVRGDKTAYDLEYTTPTTVSKDWSASLTFDVVVRADDQAKTPVTGGPGKYTVHDIVVASTTVSFVCDPTGLDDCLKKVQLYIDLHKIINGKIDLSSDSPSNRSHNCSSEEGDDNDDDNFFAIKAYAKIPEDVKDIDCTKLLSNFKTKLSIGSADSTLKFRGYKSTGDYLSKTTPIEGSLLTPTTFLLEYVAPTGDEKSHKLDIVYNIDAEASGIELSEDLTNTQIQRSVKAECSTAGGECAKAITTTLELKELKPNSKTTSVSADTTRNHGVRRNPPNSYFAAIGSAGLSKALADCGELAALEDIRIALTATANKDSLRNYIPGNTTASWTSKLEVVIPFPEKSGTATTEKLYIEYNPPANSDGSCTGDDIDIKVRLAVERGVRGSSGAITHYELVGEEKTATVRVLCDPSEDDCPKALSIDLDLLEMTANGGVSTGNSAPTVRKHCIKDKSINDFFAVSPNINTGEVDCANYLEFCSATWLIKASDGTSVAEYSGGGETFKNELSLPRSGADNTIKLRYTVPTKAADGKTTTEGAIDISYTLKDTVSGEEIKTATTRVTVSCAGEDDKDKKCGEGLTVSVELTEHDSTTSVKSPRNHAKTPAPNSYFDIKATVGTTGTGCEDWLKTCKYKWTISGGKTKVNWYRPNLIYKDPAKYDIESDIIELGSSVPSESIEYEVPNENKSTTVTVTCTIYSADGKTVIQTGSNSVVVKNDEKASEEPGEEPEPDLPETICGVLDYLKVDPPLSITACKNDTPGRTIGLSSGYDAVDCEYFNKHITGGGIVSVVTNCKSSDWKTTISAGLSSGPGINVDGGTISINAGDIVNKAGDSAVVRGSQIVLPDTGGSLDCKTLGSMFVGSGGIQVSPDCDGTSPTISFTLNSGTISGWFNTWMSDWLDKNTEPCTK